MSISYIGMDWLRNNSFIGRQSRSLICTDEDCDPTACYDSFKEHWHQVLKIIHRSKVSVCIRNDVLLTELLPIVFSKVLEMPPTCITNNIVCRK